MSDETSEHGRADEERRSEERKKIRVGVTMDSGSNLYVGFTDNISEGGLFVATHELVDIGTLIDLEFKLPGHDEPVRVRGEVRWQRTVAEIGEGVFPGFGVEFHDLSESDLERGQKFLNSREPIFHPE